MRGDATRSRLRAIERAFEMSALAEDDQRIAVAEDRADRVASAAYLIGRVLFLLAAAAVIFWGPAWARTMIFAVLAVSALVAYGRAPTYRGRVVAGLYVLCAAGGASVWLF